MAAYVKIGRMTDMYRMRFEDLDSFSSDLKFKNFVIKKLTLYPASILLILEKSFINPEMILLNTNITQVIE